MTVHLRSMTGFGEAESRVGLLTVTAQLRSVNHKSLDVRFTAPAALQALETEAISRLRAVIARGRVELRLSMHSEGEGLATRAAALADELRALSRAAGLTGELTLRDLAQAGLYSDQQTTPDDDAHAVEAALSAIDAALEPFMAFRAREGASLRATFDEHVDSVEGALAALAPLAESEIEAYTERLRARIVELLPDGVVVDEARLLHEAALVAQRADIAEERQRAAEHLRAVHELLDGPGPHGKALDFLLQELIRETNTMASKSQSAAMTHIIVRAKTAIERMREQAPNVE